jgi:tetratricopeptide (TPR) repeat protein
VTAADTADEAAPKRPRDARPAILAVGLLIVLAVFAVFGRTLGYGFVDWDDPLNVSRNPHLTPPVTAAGVAYLWRHPYFELYAPVSYSAWALCAWLGQKGGGTAPFSGAPFHAMNVALHAANALLVFTLLLRLSGEFGDGYRGRSAVAAAAIGTLLFAVHPLQVESVAWVTGGNNVVSGFFALLALNAYLSYARCSDGRGRAVPWYAGATALYALALLAKPTAAAVPLVAAVLEVAVLRRPWRRWAPGLLLWAAGAVVLALATRAASPMSRMAAAEVPAWGRPFLAGDALAFYLGKFVRPHPLAVDYGRHPTRAVLASWWGYATWLVPAALGLLAWRLRLRGLAAALLVFVAATLPVLGLVPFYFQRMSTVADRYVYLGLLGPALGVAWGPAALRNDRRAAPLAAAGAVCAVLGALSWAQAGVWRDTVTLFTHAAAVNPRSAVAHSNLSVALGERGDAAGALREARAAVELGPEDAGRAANLGVALARSGDTAGAREAFARAVTLAPGDASAHYHLGTALADLGRGTEAAAELWEAVRLNPRFAEAWFRLGTTLGGAPGGADEAVLALGESLRLEPGRAEAHYIRGVLLGGQERYAEAEADFAAAARLTPDYAEAHYNLALVRDRQGKAEEALPEYREAARLAPAEQRYADALASAEKRTAAGGGGAPAGR